MDALGAVMNVDWSNLTPAELASWFGSTMTFFAVLVAIFIPLIGGWLSRRNKRLREVTDNRMTALLLFTSANYIRGSVQAAAEAAERSEVNNQAIRQYMSVIESQIDIAKAGLLASNSFPETLVHAQMLFNWSRICVVYFEDVFSAGGDKEDHELTANQIVKRDRAIRVMAKVLPEALVNIRSAEEELRRISASRPKIGLAGRCWESARSSKLLIWLKNAWSDEH